MADVNAERLVLLATLLTELLADVDPGGAVAKRVAAAERQRKKREREREAASRQNVTERQTTVTPKRDEPSRKNVTPVTAPEIPPLEPPSQKDLTDQKISSEKQSSFPLDESSKTSRSASDARDEKRDTNGVTGVTGVTASHVTARDSEPVTRVTKKVKRTRGVKTSLPEDFAVSEAMECMCLEEGLPDPHVVIRDFKDKARANGYRYIDWEAAFRTWMRSDITKRSYPPQEKPPEIFRHPDRDQFIQRDDETFDDYLARREKRA